MKDLTVLYPEWFEQNQANFTQNVRKTLNLVKDFDNIKFCIFSNICHKCIIEVYRRLRDSELTCIYNFDDNTYITLDEGEYTNFNFRLGVKEYNYYTKEETSNFVYAELYTEHVNQYGELDEKYKFILDSKFNNAPNLSGKDITNSKFRSNADIVGDLLYFEHSGIRYLIDGDYGIVAKFPKKLDIAKNRKHATSDTKQFILKDGKEWCLYDVNKKKIIINNIISVGESIVCDFKTKEGNIYKYDKNKGEFYLESTYDSFCDNLKEILTCPYKDMYYNYILNEPISNINPSYIVHIMKNKEGKFFIVHNNKVINKNCPFDSIKRIKDINNDDYGKFICRVNDMEDIYESYNKFRFDTLNLTGKQEKLWFDKD